MAQDQESAVLYMYASYQSAPVTESQLKLAVVPGAGQEPVALGAGGRDAAADTPEALTKEKIRNTGKSRKNI